MAQGDDIVPLIGARRRNQLSKSLAAANIVLNREDIAALTVVIPFTDPVIAGKFVYHCHAVDHEDKGMMGSPAALGARGLQMLNPRGRSLRDIEQVEQLLGLVLLTIDPPERAGGSLFEGMTITNVAKFFMRRWIAAGRDFLTGAPHRHLPPPFGR